MGDILAMLALYVLSAPFYMGPEFQGNPNLQKLGVSGALTWRARTTLHNLRGHDLDADIHVSSQRLNPLSA